LCDTELSQSGDNIVVKSHTRAQPKLGFYDSIILSEVLFLFLVHHT